MFDAQGEDVVAGTHQTEPIGALDERLPAVAAELRAHATRLEHHFADLCDIEFTIEDGRLWMLQVRVGKRSPQAALRIAVDMAEDPSFPLSRAEAVERVAPLLAHPPTVATVRSGFVLPLVERAPGLTRDGERSDRHQRQKHARAAAEAGPAAILVRTETSPDDVHGMAAAAGILTSRGGLASHAAVVARGWGIPAVVGATAVEVRDGSVAIGDRILRRGDVITIDGSSGEVFDGAIPGTTEVVPEARTLLAWARDLGIAIGGDAPGEASVAPVAARKVTPDDALRAVAMKGFAPIPGVADAVISTPDVVGPILDQLVVDGLLTTTAGAYRLTEIGHRPGRTTCAPSSRRPGASTVPRAALDEFVALDHRMKDIVTAWQLRDDVAVRSSTTTRTPGTTGAVLDRLAAVHADAVTWLAPFEAGCPRLADYRAAAWACARAGARRRPAVRRLTARRQLPRDLVRAPRGPDRAGWSQPRRRGGRRAGVASRRAATSDQRPLAYPRAVSLSQSEPALLFWM